MRSIVGEEENLAGDFLEIADRESELAQVKRELAAAKEELSQAKSFIETEEGQPLMGTKKCKPGCNVAHDPPTTYDFFSNFS